MMKNYTILKQRNKVYNLPPYN